MDTYLGLLTPHSDHMTNKCLMQYHQKAAGTLSCKSTSLSSVSSELEYKI